MQTDAFQATLHAHLRSPVGLNQVDKYLTASGFRHPDWHSHMAGGWNEMVCKIPSKSSHPMAVILLFACFTPTYKMLKAHGVLPPACISAGIGDNPVSQDLSGLPFPKPSHHTSVTLCLAASAFLSLSLPEIIHLTSLAFRQQEHGARSRTISSAPPVNQSSKSEALTQAN